MIVTMNKTNVSIGNTSYSKCQHIQTTSIPALIAPRYSDSVVERETTKGLEISQNK